MGHCFIEATRSCMAEYNEREFHSPSMSQANDYYELCSTTMDPCTMERAPYARAKQTWLCTGCLSPKPGVPAVDATIQEEKPDDTPLNIIMGCGLGVAKESFFLAFGDG